MPLNYERVLVTPVLAEKWLNMNHPSNRRKRPQKIEAYAHDMRGGAWNSDSGETIKFASVDEIEWLIDGQNRLSAVIEADTAIEFDVVHGLSQDTIGILDSGVARTAGDTLRIRGAVEVYRIASIVRWAIGWDEKNYVLQSRRDFTPATHSDILQRYKLESHLFDAAADRARDCQRAGLGTGTPPGMAFYLFSKIDMTDAHNFFDRYVSGTNLSEGDPILTLRNRVIRGTRRSVDENNRGESITRVEHLAMFIRAWNHYRNDKPLYKMMSSRGLLTNVNFPQPK